MASTERVFVSNRGVVACMYIARGESSNCGIEAEIKKCPQETERTTQKHNFSRFLSFSSYKEHTYRTGLY